MDKLDDALATAKHGSKALENLTDVFKKIAGPLASEVGLMLGDKAREYRMQNWINCQKRIAAMLLDADSEPHAIPPRQFLPMLEAASLEDDATLQELWAALIANASIAPTPFPSAFISFLQELSPLEAEVLNELWKRSVKLIREYEEHWRSSSTMRETRLQHHSVPRDVTLADRLLELIATIRQVIRQKGSNGIAATPLDVLAEMFLTNLLRLGILEDFPVNGEEEHVHYAYDPETRYHIKVCFTPLGWMFVNSCQPPANSKGLLPVA